MNGTSDNPMTLPEIQTALAQGQMQLSTIVESVEAEMFFAHAPDTWSMAENIVHLIDAAEQFSTGLASPKVTLHQRFGTPNHSSRTFGQLRSVYAEILAGGGRSNAANTPQNINVDVHFSHARDDIMQRWQRATRQLFVGLRSWNETELDATQVPHPLLGNLTVREMLFFFVFHDAHHLAEMRKLGYE